MNKRMKEIMATIKTLKDEATAFKTEKKFDDAQAKIAEIESLQKEYEVERTLFEDEKDDVPDDTGKDFTPADADTKAFDTFVRKANSSGMSQGSNGAIVPVTIADKIIEQVTELSPIVDMATKYYTKGTLEIPVYGTDSGVDSPTGDIAAAYQGDEFTALTVLSPPFSE